MGLPERFNISRTSNHAWKYERENQACLQDINSKHLTKNCWKFSQKNQNLPWPQWP